MKAVVYTGKGVLEYLSVPVPKINDSEILLRVTCCGLCGTDVKNITHGEKSAPRIFGHEIIGVVEKVGKNVSKYKAGDRLMVYHHVGCEECEECRNENDSYCDMHLNIDTTAGFTPSGGGFAEYVKIPKEIVQRGLIRIPDNIPDWKAVFIEPLNCCMKAVEKANPTENDNILVIGQGEMGNLIAQVLSRLYSTNVTVLDLNNYKLGKSRESGIENILNPRDANFEENIMKLAGKKGFDSCFVTPDSYSAIELAVKYTRTKGKIVISGGAERDLEISSEIFNRIYKKDLQIIGSRSSSYHFKDMAAEIIFTGAIELEHLVTHNFSLNELGKAVELANNAKKGLEESLKVLILPKTL